MGQELVRMQALFATVRYRGEQDTDCLLLEPNPAAKIKNILIQNDTSQRNWFLLHPDRDRACSHDKKKCSVNSPHFAVKSGFIHHQVCDGILVMQEGVHITIFYFDLKSTSTSGVSAQFKSMKCFVRYTLALIDYAQQPVEKAFCFICNPDSKLTPKDRFKKNEGLTSNLEFPVFEVRVRNGQKLCLSEFCNTVP